MQQQINLYLPEFRTKKDVLTPLLMGQILSGVIAVFVLVSVFDIYTRWQLNGELAERREVLTDETRKTDEIDEQLARRSENPQLTARLEQAEYRLEASRQIVEFLSERQLGNLQGFSEYIKDLSRASIEGLSINSFEISNGGEIVNIQGEVLDSAMVPRYVDNIERGQSPLKDKTFGPSISRTDSTARYFSFDLSSVND